MWSIVASFLIVAVCAQPNPIPGIEQLGRGFDAATWSWKSNPIVQFTWDAPYTFDSLLYPGKSWLYPPEVIVREESSSGYLDVSIEIKSVQDIVDSLVSKVKNGGFLGIGKKSKTTIKFSRNYNENSQGLLWNEREFALYTASLQTQVTLAPTFTPEAQFLIDSLPTQYGARGSPEWLAYRDALQILGTHVVTEISAGGSIQMSSYYHTCLSNKFGSSWVQQNGGFSFLGFLSWNTEKDQWWSQVDQTWKENTLTEFQMVGGNTQMFDPTMFDSWISSLPDRPGVIDWVLYPLDLMILDETKGENLAQAIAEYASESNQEADNLFAQFAAHASSEIPDFCQ